MEKAVTEVGMASLSASVFFGWAPLILGVPAAVYYSIKIYNEFIRKDQQVP